MHTHRIEKAQEAGFVSHIGELWATENGAVLYYYMPFAWILGY